MGHENGGKQRLAKRRHVQGMLDETDPLKADFLSVKFSKRAQILLFAGENVAQH